MADCIVWFIFPDFPINISADKITKIWTIQTVHSKCNNATPSNITNRNRTPHYIFSQTFMLCSNATKRIFILDIFKEKQKNERKKKLNNIFRVQCGVHILMVLVLLSFVIKYFKNFFTHERFSMQTINGINAI